MEIVVGIVVVLAVISFVLAFAIYIARGGGDFRVEFVAPRFANLVLT